MCGLAEGCFLCGLPFAKKALLHTLEYNRRFRKFHEVQELPRTTQGQEENISEIDHKTIITEPPVIEKPVEPVEHEPVTETLIQNETIVESEAKLAGSESEKVVGEDLEQVCEEISTPEISVISAEPVLTAVTVQPTTTPPPTENPIQNSVIPLAGEM